MTDPTNSPDWTEDDKHQVLQGEIFPADFFHDKAKEAIIRAGAVAGLVFLIFFSIYGRYVFVSTVPASGLISNGITVGIAYATFRSSNIPKGLYALLLWYLFITIVWFHYPYHASNFIMEGSYVVGLTVAVFAYLHLADKYLLHRYLPRIITASLIIGIAHGAIVAFLGLISLRIFNHLVQTLGWSYSHFRNGIVIGLLAGIGMEIAELWIASSRHHHIKSQPV